MIGATRRLPNTVLIAGHVRSNRRGVALLAAIVALAIFTALCHSLAGLAVAAHRQAEHDREQAQARLLAESGLMRTVAQFSADPQWSGETWSPEFSNENGSRKRKATVVIERLPDEAGRDIRFRVTARLSLSASDERQVVRELAIPQAADVSN